MKKRSIRLAGHETSLSLEDQFWIEIKKIAAERGMSVNALLTRIDEDRETDNLSSACRIFVLDYYIKTTA